MTDDGARRGGPIDAVLSAAGAGPPAMDELVGGAGPVLALVSGGRDSVCLLDVLVTLLGAERVSALHVDYGLRPESGQDADHVRALCARLGVPVRVHRARRAPGDRGNVQAWAREVRYAQAERAAPPGAPIATGHTSTDQLETVLYRLASSPGRRALLGMAPIHGRVVRPLLGVSREQTAAYCTARGLRWREDASNASPLYARARVREGLAQALREIHPEAERNALRTIGLLREEADVLARVVDSVLEGGDRVALSRLAELPPALARLVAVRLAEDAAGRLVPAAGTRVAELLALAPRGGSASLDLGGGVRAIVEYGVLRFAAGAEPPVPEPVVLEVPGVAGFGAWTVRCLPAAGARPAEPGSLDADRLGASVLVRPWRPGDRIRTDRGSRTLADLFIDRHVPRAERRVIPVVEAAGAIAWVPGVAAGASFAATPATRRAVRLLAQRLA
jgi:tRNA(Ile)-lysidine synthase